MSQRPSSGRTTFLFTQSAAVPSFFEPMFLERCWSLAVIIVAYVVDIDVEDAGAEPVLADEVGAGLKVVVTAGTSVPSTGATL